VRRHQLTQGHARSRATQAEHQRERFSEFFVSLSHCEPLISQQSQMYL
jgi:hypothetical protein